MRHAQIWGAEYLKQGWRREIAQLAGTSAPVERIWVTLADHYEPMWHDADLDTAKNRVALWHATWPPIAAQCKRDSAGRPPIYTFFYPEEEYQPALVEPLAQMSRAGIADVEVHLHHDGEGPDNFMTRIARFCERLDGEHGLLHRAQGKLTFGFIHGNWALDNSRPDGRWCGLNNEISLLRDLGCYADFTMPSGDSPTQAHMINTIYYCHDDPHRPKSYDSGAPLTPGGSADDLLMIPGPLGVRWKDRLLPRMETGELCAGNVATPYRVRRWVDLAPRIGGDSFVKLYSHGAQERHSSALLGGALQIAFDLLVAEASRRNCSLYFASAWQMYLAIDAIRRRCDPTCALQSRTSEDLTPSWRTANA